MSLDPNVLDFLKRLGSGLAVLVVALLVARFSKAALLRLARRGRIAVNVATLFGNVLRVIAVTIGLFALLNVFQLDWSGLLTVLGALGITAGIALQDVLRSIVAGIYILIEQPFKIGDLIRVRDGTGTVEGTVQGIELRTTLLRTEDGTQVIVPNATVFTMTVINDSAYNLQRQVVEIGTSLTLEAMNTKVKHVLSQFAEVVPNPSPEVRVVSISGTKTNFRVIYWTKPEAAVIASQIAVALQGDSPTREIKIG